VKGSKRKTSMLMVIGMALSVYALVELTVRIDGGGWGSRPTKVQG
jgi:hypothetical protein